MQCSWASQDSKRGILIPFFFLWHQSDLFGHKERKSTPPSEKDWEVRTQIMPEPQLQTEKNNRPGNESPTGQRAQKTQKRSFNYSDMLLGCWDSANQFIICPLATKYATMRGFCSDTISEIQKNYKERLTYTCLSSSPAVCSENKLSGEPQTISSCHVPAPV